MIPALCSLSDTDLRAIVSALRAGRLTAPFTGTALQRFCSAGNEEAVAREMHQLAEDGMKPDHQALMLDAIASDRAQHRELREPVDLVWTGPEAAGLANRDTGVVVRELFANAHEYVLLAGFAVHQGRDVFRCLAERMTELPKLRVRMFLDVRRQPHDATKEFELVRAFANRFKTVDWPGGRLPEIYYDPRSLEMDASKRSSLHAKCIVIDRKVAFVSSANFTEAAQVRNIEVGVLIQSARFAARLAEHFDGLEACKQLRLLWDV